MSDILNTYIKHGWVIHALWPNKKAPMNDKWSTCTTKDNFIDNFNKHVTKYPDCNVGLLCGKISNVVVLDIDILKSKDDPNKYVSGMPVWQQFEQEHGILDTPTVMSPSGGRHIYFLYDHETALIKNGLGVLKTQDGKTIKWDVLTDNESCGAANLVLPPSIHPDGGQYTWIKSPVDYPVMTMPLWLLKLLPKKVQEIEGLSWNGDDVVKSKKQKKTKPNTKIIVAKVEIPTKTYDPYTKSHVEELVNTLECYDDYDEWIKVGRYVKSCGNKLEDLDWSYDLWDDWSSNSKKYNSKEIGKKWDTFVLDGNDYYGALVNLLKVDIKSYWWKGMNYKKIKQQFELNHFKCMNPICFYTLTSDGKYEIKTKKQLEDTYQNVEYPVKIENKLKKLSFIDSWLFDPLMRQYERVVFLPPPLPLPPNCFNLWDGFVIEKEPPVSCLKYKTELDNIYNHFQLVFGECYEYIMKWIAMLFQKPGEKPLVCNIIKSKQGLGKGLVFELLQAMIGAKYCYLTQKSEQHVLGTVNCMIEGKLLVVLDEMNYSVSKKCEESIKDLITNPLVDIKRLFISPYESQNHMHMFVYSNQDFPWVIPEGDRRCNAVDRAQAVIPDRAYFNTLGNYINNKPVMRALFQNFMCMNISEYDPRAKPETEFTKELQELSRPIEIEFFINLIILTDHDVLYSSTTLYSMFTEFKEKYFPGSTNYKPSHKIFTLKIKNYNIDGLIKKHTKRGTIYQLEIIPAKTWINKNNYHI